MRRRHMRRTRRRRLLPCCRLLLSTASASSREVPVDAVTSEVVSGCVRTGLPVRCELLAGHEVLQEIGGQCKLASGTISTEQEEEKE
eukprot:454026-Pyramimonas_sp.AAC.1